MLRADSLLAPQPDEPFLVLDDALRVRAMSRLAEKLFGLPEKDALKRHVNEFLTPAESIFPDQLGLMALLAGATRQSPDAFPSNTVAVRRPREFGVRYSARVGPCIPSPAALVVLTPL
jgi:PAS domain-containing protein